MFLAEYFFPASNAQYTEAANMITELNKITGIRSNETSGGVAIWLECESPEGLESLKEGMNATVDALGLPRPSERRVNINIEVTRGLPK